ncbi:uncharacterized protein UV8b_04778 [Ustilaginoidea virens]|uniref:Uncharacterized protein n=1 Tax=Ustilaginoidea virens TaxID=1159556 RepID=A0A8E5MI17_USTVR|nr:uncharacterized protein UV8b_04778 [Ustilaginoidea virens]QUC20537.1 hypothetical protein UV8b_04778 [Ustilaginoidea virens]
MVKDASIWTIVHAAVTGFVVVPIFMVGVLTLVLARQRDDAARKSFRWLKWCHPLLLVSLTCIIAADVLNVVLFSWQNDSGYYDTAHHTHDEISSVIRSERYLSFTGNLFEHLVDLIFVTVLVELGNGLMYSLDRQPSAYQARLRYASYAATMVLATFALTYFGQPTAAWMAYWNGSETNSSYAQLIQSLKVVGKIGASFYIPSWIVSIWQVAYASFVLHKHKAGVLTRHVAILYVTTAVLDFIRWTLFVILYAQFILPASDSPWWWTLVDALGNTWLRFVQLVLLLIIGMRRKKGIWTTHQRWMATSMSNEASDMASTMAGPSPTTAPGTAYHHAYYPQSKPVSPASTEPAWYASQEMPAWQNNEQAMPQPVIIMPREFESMQYQYVPHPLLGPGYLVLKSQPQIQELQQQQEAEQEQQPVTPIDQATGQETA